tara:strand:+ start:182 stop:673 length:492 start_codon:yes stop_codon:yes gene_type:complete
VANPNALDRREYLYSKPKKKPDFEALGTNYQESGNLSDALECYERIEEEGKRTLRLKGIREIALKQGNHFILNWVGNSLPLSQEEWHSAALTAKSLGKIHYAYKSAQRAEDEALVNELREALGIPDPSAPQPGAEGFVDYLQSGEGAIPEAGAEEVDEQGAVG